MNKRQTEIERPGGVDTLLSCQVRMNNEQKKVMTWFGGYDSLSLVKATLPTTYIPTLRYITQACIGSHTRHPQPESVFTYVGVCTLLWALGPTAQTFYPHASSYCSKRCKSHALLIDYNNYVIVKTFLLRLSIINRSFTICFSALIKFGSVGRP